VILFTHTHSIGLFVITIVVVVVVFVVIFLLLTEFRCVAGCRFQYPRVNRHTQQHTRTRVRTHANVPSIDRARAVLAVLIFVLTSSRTYVR
jgi:hypothetical protein